MDFLDFINTLFQKEFIMFLQPILYAFLINRYMYFEFFFLFFLD